jgi:outer membrane protein, heavy metal efflux system
MSNSFLPRFARPLAAGGWALGLASCAIAPPDVDAGEAVARSLDLSDAIVFSMQALPLDAAAADGVELPASTAVLRAIETSAELQAALARVRVAQMDAELAGLLPNPVLSIAVRVPAGHASSIIDVGLAGDLLAILQREGRASAAGHRLQAEATLAVATALDVVARVQAQYAEVQALEALLPILGERLAVFDKLQEVAQARLDVGEASRRELTAVEAERAELAVDVAGRRRELRLARLALARQIGEPSSAASWRLQPWSPPAPVPTDEAQWIRAALASRPELAAIDWEIRARSDEQELAGGLSADGSGVGAEAEFDDDWSVGPAVAVPLPLSDTGGRQAERAAALTAEARHRRTEAERAVVEEVRGALATLQGAQSSLERIATDLVPLQQRRLDELEQSWTLGQVDLVTVLMADESLRLALARRIELERDVSAALYRLQRAVGGPQALRSVANGVASP